MAIDNTGISSLDTGASDIRLTGNQNPGIPNQKFAGGGQRGQMAQERAMEIAEEEYGRDFYDLNDSLQHRIYKRALQEIDEMFLSQRGPGNMRMASADPILQDEYDKYVFELQEIRPEAVPMTIEEFRQQAISGRAQGGRAGFQGGGDAPPAISFSALSC